MDFKKVIKSDQISTKVTKSDRPTIWEMWRNVSIFIAINPINAGAPLSHRIFGKVEDEFKLMQDLKDRGVLI